MKKPDGIKEVLIIAQITQEPTVKQLTNRKLNLPKQQSELKYPHIMYQSTCRDNV